RPEVEPVRRLWRADAGPRGDGQGLQVGLPGVLAAPSPRVQGDEGPVADAVAVAHWAAVGLFPDLHPFVNAGPAVQMPTRRDDRLVSLVEAYITLKSGIIRTRPGHCELLVISARYQLVLKFDDWAHVFDTRETSIKERGKKSSREGRFENINPRTCPSIGLCLSRSQSSKSSSFSLTFTFLHLLLQFLIRL
ncbi:unnamed protein product, partial [Heterosigma akashiwo]